MTNYNGSPVTPNRYMRMLTEKGLLYIIRNNDNLAEQKAAKDELDRRIEDARRLSRSQGDSLLEGDAVLGAGEHAGAL